MSWIERLFCCTSSAPKKHIPTPSKRQIQLWEAREVEIREIRKAREQIAENER